LRITNYRIPIATAQTKLHNKTYNGIKLFAFFQKAKMLDQKGETTSAQQVLRDGIETAQQAGDAHPLWASASPCVWTVRMLATLWQGVEGGKWFRLIDKVFSERNLFAAFQQVASKKGAAGVDHVKVDEFSRQIPESIWQLSDTLKAGTFCPQTIRRVNIPKPGTKETRPLGIPTVRDRIVQAAVVNVIEPIFERARFRSNTVPNTATGFVLAEVARTPCVELTHS